MFLIFSCIFFLLFFIFILLIVLYLTFFLCSIYIYHIDTYMAWDNHYPFIIILLYTMISDMYALFLTLFLILIFLLDKVYVDTTYWKWIL